MIFLLETKLKNKYFSKKGDWRTNLSFGQESLQLHTIWEPLIQNTNAKTASSDFSTRVCVRDFIRCLQIVFIAAHPFSTVFTQLFLAAALFANAFIHTLYSYRVHKALCERSAVRTHDPSMKPDVFILCIDVSGKQMQINNTHTHIPQALFVLPCINNNYETAAMVSTRESTIASCLSLRPFSLAQTTAQI